MAQKTIALSSVRWIYLVISSVCMLFAGVIYAWSILKEPLAAEFGWNASQLALNFTITMCCFCIGGIASSLLLKKIPLTMVMTIAAVLCFIGFALTANLSGQIIGLYISYGILSGTGIGIAYNALLSTTNLWFPDKKGLSSGVQMMSFGVSTLLLGNVAGYFIGLPSFGWRPTFVLIGALLGALLLFSAFIMKPPSKEMVFLQEENAETNNNSIVQADNFTTAQMLRHKSFWRFFTFQVCMTAVGNATVSMAKDVALSVGATASLATLLVGVLSVCNGLGRLTAGCLFDRQGRKKTMLIGNIITVAAPVAILVSFSTQSIVLCAVGLCLCGLSYGFSPPISSAVTMEFYGRQNYATNFSISNTMLMPASFIATLSGYLVNMTESFTASFVVLTILAVVSLLLNLTIKKPTALMGN